jgi:Amt family ammonium transporter
VETPSPARSRRPRTAARLALALALAAGRPAGADDGGGVDTGDTAWMLVATALVLFMTLPGLALFYGGLVRTKNVLSVLMQCFGLTGLISLLWLAFGYSLAFDSSGMEEGRVGLASFVGGLSKAFLAGVDAKSQSGTIPEVLFFAYQMTFAIITPALVVGAFAERMKFSATLWLSALWLVLVYVPVCHMVWGGKGAFLADLGVFDFAGGIVVHITAGVAALVACVVVGPRFGYPGGAFIPHNMTMTAMGTGMLWVGWFGFNGGSALGANGDAALAIAVTHVSACAAGLAWMAIEWFKHGKPSMLGLATGAVAGLAAVTPASGFVGPIGGLAIGLASGVVCFLAATSMKRALGYDDSLDVFGVHGVGGFVGTVMVAFFAASALGGKHADLAIGRQLAVQLGAALGVAAYTAVMTWAILKLLDRTLGLRVKGQHESQGLDLALHEEAGYRF